MILTSDSTAENPYSSPVLLRAVAHGHREQEIMFKEMTIGRKIGLGFGVIMILLVAVASLSYTGIDGIVANAGEVITGNKINGNMAQKEVDHLNWVNEVSGLLTDKEITKLTVQTDDHKCGFGKWLYGPERKEAEKSVPSIAPLLKKIEGHHANLHTSAIEIGNHFKQADTSLPGTLAAREVDHLNWATKINTLFLNNLPNLEVTTDPTKCKLGHWFDSKDLKEALAADPQLSRLIDGLKEPHSKLHTSAIAIQNTYRQIHPGLVDTLRQRLDDHRRWAAAVANALINNEKVNVQLDHTKCAFGKWLKGEECQSLCRSWPEFAEIMTETSKYHKDLHDSAEQICSHWREVHPGLESTLQSRLDDHRRWAASVSTALLTGSTINSETDSNKCAFGKWLAGDDCRKLCTTWPEFAAKIDKIKKHHENLHASVVDINNTANQDGKVAIYQNTTLAELDAVSNLFNEAIDLENANVQGNEIATSIYHSQTLPALENVSKHITGMIELERNLVTSQQEAKSIFENQTLPALKEVRTALDHCKDYAASSLEGMHKANEVFASQTKPSLEHVQTLLGQIRSEVKNNVMTDETMLAAAQKTKLTVTVIGAISIIVGILLASLIARGIIKALTSIIASLNEGADQLNDAAGQLSASAQELASGSSEQASSLEQTSAALQQMAAMTRANAENSKQADVLSNKARSGAEEGDRSMSQLTSAMTELDESSGEISKIIKVIEEIAFQTNLLALNAAVEAARAGEHGKGFAVVAEEVRNLAQRAAQAARETTGLIENSVVKTKEGSNVSGLVANSFGVIVQEITEVTGLINNISNASTEQAEGVEQLNSAVAQIDKVTQQSASGAEESASAAEELSAQATNMKTMVDELAAMAGIRHSQNKSTPELHTGKHGSLNASTSKTQRNSEYVKVRHNNTLEDKNDFLDLDSNTEKLEAF